MKNRHFNKERNLVFQQMKRNLILSHVILFIENGGPMIIQKLKKKYFYNIKSSWVILLGPLIAALFPLGYQYFIKEMIDSLYKGDVEGILYISGVIFVLAYLIHITINKYVYKTIENNFWLDLNHNVTKAITRPEVYETNIDSVSSLRKNIELLKDVAWFVREKIEMPLKIVSIIVLVGYLLLSISYKFILYFSLFIPLFVIIGVIGMVLGKLRKKLILKEKSTNFLAQEIIENTDTIQIYGVVNTFQKRCDNSNHQLKKIKLKLYIYEMLLELLNILMGIVMIISVPLICSFLASKGEISTGEVFIASVIIQTLVENIGGVINYFSKAVQIKTIENELNLDDCSSKFYHVKDGNQKDSVDRLILNDVNKSFGDSKILDGITYSFEKGNIYFIGGGNGVGKSTLLKVLTKEIGLDSGEIILDGTVVHDKKFVDAVAYVPQDTKLFSGGMWDNVCTNDKDRVVKKWCLESIFSKQVLLNEQEVETLSGGQKKYISIIRATEKESKILILDEPTANLNKMQKEIFLKNLKTIKSNKIVLIVSHDDQVAQIADRKIQLSRNEGEKWTEKVQ